MRIKWIGEKRITRGYGVKNADDIFEASDRDAKSFISQGLAKKEKTFVQKDKEKK